MLIRYIKRRMAEKEELNQIEFRNSKRRADINATIAIASIGEENARNWVIKARHSRFKAQAEAIRDRVNLIDRAVQERNLPTARALEKVCDTAINALSVV